MYNLKENLEETAVNLDDKTQGKQQIEYPTNWGFKLIGRDKDALLVCIKEALGEKEHLCSLGNASKTGKFHSYNASCNVETEEERNRIFKYFEDHKDVDMVI